jgi:outer membrane protein TolC
MKFLLKAVLATAVFVTVSNAVELKELITDTLKNNQNLKADRYYQEAKQKSYQSVKNIYNPKFTGGLNYNRLDLDVRNTQIVNTGAAFVKFSLSLYDGGKNSALKKQKLYEYKAQKFQNVSNIKNTVLNVVTLYFNLKTVEENIQVYKEKGRALKAQYERMKTKYDLKMATREDVLKLKSEYESNLYTVEELKYQKTELIKNIELYSGVKISALDTETIPDISVKYSTGSNVKALEENVKAVEENVNIAKSSKKPQLKIEDTLSYYRYSDYNEKLLNDLPDKQNQLNITLTFNIFDTSTKSNIESSKLVKLATQSRLEFAKKQAKTDFELAREKLLTQKAKIKSLQSAVNMANSVYDTVKIKYENGLVDNITYLDALSKKTYYLALYKQAQNELQILKADYYLKSGIDYKKLLGLLQ